MKGRSVCLITVFLGLSACCLSQQPEEVIEAKERGFKVARISLEEMKQEPRLALVIGNADYDTKPLRNPVNDADLMAETLEEVGFKVIKHHNLGQKAMKRAVDDFGRLLASGGVGLVYYAGHAVQLDGRNYLIPIDAPIRFKKDIDIEAVKVDRLLNAMEHARARVNLVILDACRDNPFPSEIRGGQSGLANTTASRGTLIAYSTAPGGVAVDGRGEHSPYTLALAREMKEPGLAVERVFKRVRTSVRETTGSQQPWESTSLEGEFFFVLPQKEKPAELPKEVRERPTVTEKKPVRAAEEESVGALEDTGSYKVAKAAYVAFTDAFNKRDMEAYQTSLKDPMDCYFDRRFEPSLIVKQGIEKNYSDNTTKLKLDRFEPISATANEVHFRVFGSDVTQKRGPVPYKKYIIMKRVDGRWLVSTIVGFRNCGCMPEAFPELDCRPPWMKKR